MRQTWWVGVIPIFLGICGAMAEGVTPPPASEVTSSVTWRALQRQKWFAFGGTYFRLLAVAKTGSMPKGVTVTPDGAHVIVTNFGQHDSKNVYRYDPATLEVTARAAFPGNSVEILPSRDGKLVYVSNFYHRQLLGLDPATLEVKRAYQVGKVPKHFALSPDGKRAFVANWESESISVVDLVTNVGLRSVKVGFHPRGTTITNDGKKVYVTNTGEHTISIIDTETLTATKQKACKFPRHAATTPAGLVIISCLGTHYVHVYDPGTDTVVHKVEVGHGPKTIDVSSDGRFAFTADYRGDTLSIIDLTSFTSQVVPLPIARGSGLAVSPDGRRIYVTGWDSDNLVVLERLLPGDIPGPAAMFPGALALAKLVKPEQRPDKSYQQRLEGYIKRIRARAKDAKTKTRAAASAGAK